jgi:hypothetical protein
MGVKVKERERELEKVLMYGEDWLRGCLLKGKWRK